MIVACSLETTGDAQLGPTCHAVYCNVVSVTVYAYVCVLYVCMYVLCVCMCVFVLCLSVNVCVCTCTLFYFRNPCGTIMYKAAFIRFTMAESSRPSQSIIVFQLV